MVQKQKLFSTILHHDLFWTNGLRKYLLLGFFYVEDEIWLADILYEIWRSRRIHKIRQISSQRAVGNTKWLLWCITQLPSRWYIIGLCASVFHSYLSDTQRQVSEYWKQAILFPSVPLYPLPVNSPHAHFTQILLGTIIVNNRRWFRMQSLLLSTYSTFFSLPGMTHQSSHNSAVKCQQSQIPQLCLWFQLQAEEIVCRAVMFSVFFLISILSVCSVFSLQENKSQTSNRWYHLGHSFLKSFFIFCLLVA